MAKVKIVLDRGGVRSLLRSPEMDEIIASQCHRIQTRAGSGYSSDTQRGSNRIQGRVYGNGAGKDKNTLLKSL